MLYRMCRRSPREVLKISKRGMGNGTMCRGLSKLTSDESIPRCLYLWRSLQDMTKIDTTTPYPSTLVP